MKEQIIYKAGEQAFNYLTSYIDIESKNTLVVSTTNEFNIINNQNEFNALINLSKVNNIRYINKFFEKVNAKLNTGDTFICCFETIASRKERQRVGNIPIIKNIWFGAEFVFLRMFPKMWGFKKFYFLNLMSTEMLHY